MIKVTQKGDFKNIDRFFAKTKHMNYDDVLRTYAELGVVALAASTPKDTGKTATSWGYEIQRTGKSAKIYWTNSNENDGVNIAVLIQYGHGTGTGGYVYGRDYINPAMRPVFDAIANGIWKEVIDA